MINTKIIVASYLVAGSLGLAVGFSLAGHAPSKQFHSDVTDHTVSLDKLSTENVKAVPEKYKVLVVAKPASYELVCYRLPLGGVHNVTKHDDQYRYTNPHPWMSYGTVEVCEKDWRR